MSEAKPKIDVKVENKENENKENPNEKKENQGEKKDVKKEEETKPSGKKTLNPIKQKGKAPQSERDNLKNKSIKGTVNKGKRGSLKSKSDPAEKELFLKFGHRIINYKGEEQDLDINTFLKYNIIGIFFTGSWAPPSRDFAIQVEELYKEVNKEEKVFEIIQISSEKSLKHFNDNMNENRPWLYLPFNEPYMRKLVEEYKVEFLPTFIIVNRDMYVLSENGRKDMIENEGIKAYEKWYKAYRTRKEALQKEKEEKEEQLNSQEEEHEEENEIPLE
jgi:nucleoredoxin